MATRPAAIIAMPIRCFRASCSPRTSEPRTMALTGMRKVTSARFVAPAEERIRKKMR